MSLQLTPPMALAPLQGLGSLGMLEAIRRESFRENYAGNSRGKLAIFTSCIVRCSCCHCVVMPVAMMARTAASAMVEAMYIDARLMLLPRSRSGGIESACHQHSGWEWLTKPFKKLRWGLVDRTASQIFRGRTIMRRAACLLQSRTI